MTFLIPRRGRAGVAFAGVEMADAWILLASFPIALLVGGFFGVGSKAYIGIPVAGFFLNRTLLQWQSQQLPGAVREWFFSTGLAGYSKSLKSQNVVFHGDNTILVPGRRIDAFLQKLKDEPDGNVE